LYSTVRDIHAFKVTENSEKLYYDLIEPGFDDTEFPDWWYSPARDVEVAKPRSAAAVPRSNTLSDAQDAPLGSEKTVHAPVLPLNPSPKDKVPGRPVIPERTEADRVTPPDSDITPPDSDITPPDSDLDRGRAQQTAFTDNEINLLASNKIYRSPDSGDWFHREEYSDGRTMITSVDPPRA
jgi:hypothetical protein